MTRHQWKKLDRQRRQRRWLRYQYELMQLPFTWEWNNGKWTADISAHANLKLKHYGSL